MFSFLLCSRLKSVLTIMEKFTYLRKSQLSLPKHNIFLRFVRSEYALSILIQCNLSNKTRSSFTLTLFVKCGVTAQLNEPFDFVFLGWFSKLGFLAGRVFAKRKRTNFSVPKQKAQLNLTYIRFVYFAVNKETTPRRPNLNRKTFIGIDMFGGFVAFFFKFESLF